MTKEKGVGGNAESSISPGSVSSTEEDIGELKLTGNSFKVTDEQKVLHQYTVTLESVLMGKADLVMTHAILVAILIHL